MVLGTPTIPVSVTKQYGDTSTYNVPFDQGVTIATDCEHNATETYLIKGVYTRRDAELTAYTQTPIAITGTEMVRRRVSVTELPSRMGVWNAVIEYSTDKAFNLGAIQLRGSTRGRTTKVSFAPVVSSVALVGTQIPDHGGAIGVRSDGGIDGVDVQTRSMDFSVTKKFAAGTINGAIIDVWNDLTKTTNVANWGPTPIAGAAHEYAAGELLFEEVSFDLGSAACDSATFHFSQQPNLTITLAPGKTIAKKGWEYLWVYFQDFADVTAKRKVKRPVAAYVHQVYETSAFALLGI